MEEEVRRTSTWWVEAVSNFSSLDTPEETPSEEESTEETVEE